MKTLSKILIGAGVVVIAAGGVALARGPGGCGPMGGGPMGGMGMQRMFEWLDTDKNGAVTLEEALKMADTRFDAFDTDHDGTLTKAEIETGFAKFAPPQMAARFLAMHDLDGDGKVTKAEFGSPMKKRFALFDRNDDGKVTREELALAGPMMGRGMGGGQGWHRGGGWQQGPGWGPGWGWGPGGMPGPQAPAR